MNLPEELTPKLRGVSHAWAMWFAVVACVVLAIYAPTGLFGGHDGTTLRLTKIDADGTEGEIPSKQTNFAMEAGAVLRWEQDQKLEPVRVRAMERCDAEQARRLWDEGRRLPLERAVAVALKKAVPGSSQGNWPDPRGGVLPRPDRPAGQTAVRARR